MKAPSELAIATLLCAALCVMSVTGCSERKMEAGDGAGAEGNAVVCPEDGIDLESRDIPTVSVEEAAAMIEANPKLILLDVRTPAEFAEGHLEGAVNIDYQGDSFRLELSNLDKDAQYLVYCRSGVRASYAVAIMMDLGFTHLDNMAGGYLEWTAQFRPTVK